MDLWVALNRGIQFEHILCVTFGHFFVIFAKFFNALYIYILMFHPTSLVPVEAIMTMIRAIKIDHGTDPE